MKSLLRDRKTGLSPIYVVLCAVTLFKNYSLRKGEEMKKYRVKLTKGALNIITVSFILPEWVIKLMETMKMSLWTCLLILPIKAWEHASKQEGRKTNFFLLEKEVRYFCG